MRPGAAVPVLLAALAAACASGPSENEIATRDQFLQRAVQYYGVARYPQAEQQALMGLAIDDEDAQLHLIAGRAMLMQGTLDKVVQAEPHLQYAYDHLEERSHQAAYSLAEFHYRYASLLLQHLAREEELLDDTPDADADYLAQRRADIAERRERAMEHLRRADALVDEALTEAGDALYYLQLKGQVASLLGHDDEARAALTQAIGILEESRRFKNRTLATQTNLTVEQEEQLRRSLRSDIRREIALRGVLAALYKKAGDLEAEETEYTRMLQLDPDQPAVLYSRGMVRWERGRRAEAADDLRMFLRRTDLPPEDERVRRALDLIAEYERLIGAEGGPAAG